VSTRTHQIKEDGAGHVAAAGGFVEVHIDALQLQVALTAVLQKVQGTQGKVRGLEAGV
jgi:hypothetical protein